MSKKIGIIGAGGMLQYHAAGFRAGGGELVAICDMNETAAQKAAKEYGVPHVFSDSAKMLSELPELDGIVSSPQIGLTAPWRYRPFKRESMYFAKSLRR